jgi:hypothetical protein
MTKPFGSNRTTPTPLFNRAKYPAPKFSNDKRARFLERVRIVADHGLPW